MSDKTGYTEENPGVKSSTRLIFIVGSLAVLAMTGLMVWRGTATPFDIATFLCLGMAAIGGTKVAGAMAEEKKDGSNATG